MFSITQERKESPFFLIVNVYNFHIVGNHLTLFHQFYDLYDLGRAQISVRGGQGDRMCYR